jgi:hypothetical protein
MSSKSFVIAAACVAAMFFQSFAVQQAEAGLPRIQIPLTSTGVVPAAKGRARYEADTTRRKLNIEAENLIGLEGRPAVFYVKGVVVGRSTVTVGRTKFEVDTDLGQNVPVIAAGTTVTIVINGRAIVRGSF